MERSKTAQNVKFQDIAKIILDYLMKPSDSFLFMEDVMTLRLVSKGLKNIVDNHEPVWYCFDKEQPLLMPTLLGNANAIELLLAKGADINKHGSARWMDIDDTMGLNVKPPNPLQLAARYGALTGAKILIENGADLTPGEKYQDNEYWKKRKEQEALDEKRKEELKELAPLEEKNGRFDKDESSDEEESDGTEDDDNNPFHEMLNDPMQIAALFGHIQLIELFLEKGVDIDAKDAKGQTALFAACEEGTKETVTWLIERGADTDASAKCEFANWINCKELVAWRESTSWLTRRDYEKMYADDEDEFSFSEEEDEESD